MIRHLRNLSFWTAAALALGACGSPEQWAFQKNDMSNLSKDSYECEKETRQVERSFGYGYDRSDAAFGFAIRCMEAKGYAWAPVRYPTREVIPVSGPPSTMQDPSGRVYANEEKVLCRFSSGVETVFLAWVCSQGRGSIVGPA